MKFNKIEKSQFVKTLYNNNYIYSGIKNTIDKKESKIKELKKQYRKTKNTKELKTLKSKLATQIKRQITIFNRDIDILQKYKKKITETKNITKD